jgi:hypothetical protein
LGLQEKISSKKKSRATGYLILIIESTLIRFVLQCFKYRTIIHKREIIVTVAFVEKLRKTATEISSY